MINEQKVERVLELLEEMKLQRLSHEEIAFVRDMIRKQRDESEIRLAVKKKLATGGVVTLLAGIGSAAGYLLKQWFIDNFG